MTVEELIEELSKYKESSVGEVYVCISNSYLKVISIGRSDRNNGDIVLKAY